MTDALCWLYSILIDAIRQGQLQVFTSVYPFLPWRIICHILVEAAKHGHLELVWCIQPLDHKAKIEYVYEQKACLELNALEVAAFQGHPKVARYIKEKDPNFPFDHIQEGVAALVTAVHQGNISVVDALEIGLFSRMGPSDMRSSVPSQALQDSISNGFQAACSDGNLAVVRHLLRKADYFRPGLLDSTFIAASDMGHHAILELLFLNEPGLIISEANMRSIFQRIARTNVHSVEIFLKYVEREYANPSEKARLIQSPLLAAAEERNLSIVVLLMNYHQPLIPDAIESCVADAGKFDCDSAALHQAISLRHNRALKTLIQGAMLTSDFQYLEACANASLRLSNFPSHVLPGTNSHLKMAFSGKDRTVARTLIEMLLDLKPGAPWGKEDLHGDEAEALIVHLARLCVADMRIVEILLSAGEWQEYYEKYNYMALYAAVECGTRQQVKLILDRYYFEDSSHSLALMQRARSSVEQLRLH